MVRGTGSITRCQCCAAVPGRLLLCLVSAGDTIPKPKLRHASRARTQWRAACRGEAMQKSRLRRS